MMGNIGTSVGEVIARRSSSRRYLPESVPAGLLEKVRMAGEEAEVLTDAGMDFVIPVEREITEEGMTGLFGDYGRVIRAPHYIVLIAPPGDDCLLDCGYRFEQMILEATRLGLGSCWVGGFFSKERLAKALAVRKGMAPVVLSPLGYPDRSGGARIIDGAMKLAVGASKRKPAEELFFWREAGRPLPDAAAGNGDFRFLAGAVRRAPSWANRQPWRFIFGREGVFLYKAGTQAKDGRDYHLVDCGIAMAHLHLAMESLGKKGKWTIGGSGAPEAPPGTTFVGWYTPGDPLFPED